MPYRAAIWVSADQQITRRAEFREFSFAFGGGKCYYIPAWISEVVASGKVTGAAMFLGSQQLTIDIKNRLSVPYIFRRSFNEERDGHSFYVLPGRRPRTLSLYPDRNYERILANEPSNEILSDESYAYRQFIDSHTVHMDPDNQGRVLIPEWLLESVGIGKEVVLAAVRDHLELWRRDDHEGFAKDMWAALPERRAGAVEEMKRLGASSSSATTATTVADAAAGSR